MSAPLWRLACPCGLAAGSSRARCCVCTRGGHSAARTGLLVDYGDGLAFLNNLWKIDSEIGEPNDASTHCHMLIESGMTLAG